MLVITILIIQQRNCQMLPKTPPKLKEPTSKDQSLMQRYVSIERNQRTARNLSLDIDSHSEQTKFKKEILKLREHMAILQTENMELHKLRIENQNELSLWTEKARRLNDQLIRMEEQSLRESNQINPYETSLKKEVQILNQQMRQLAAIKIQLQQKICLEKEKSESLQIKYHNLQQKVQTSNQLQDQVTQLQEIVFKYKAEQDRYETKLTRNELYINKLQGEVDYLTQQLKQQLNQLSQQKLELTNKQKQDALKEVRHYQHLLKTQQQKAQEQAMTVQGLNSQLRRVKQQFEELKVQKRTELSRLKTNSNEYETIIKQLKEENQVMKKSYQLRVNRLENQKQDRQRVNESLTKKFGDEISIYKTKIQQLNSQKKALQRKQSSKAWEIQQIDSLKRQVQYLKQQNQKFIRQIKENHQKFTYYQNKQARQGPKSERQQYSNAKHNFKSEQREYLTQRKHSELQAQLFKFEENERILVTQIDLLQRKLKQQRIQGQQLIQQLQMSRIQYAQLQDQLKKTLQQLIQQKQRDQESIDLMKKIREQESLLLELAAQNQKWKSYRLSEEDEARRQARRHKKKVQQLQNQLKNEKKVSLDAFQELQSVCQSLKQATINQQLQHTADIERQKMNLNAAMDQMEVQFRKLLNQCQQKIDSKQAQIDAITKQLEKYEKTIQKQKLEVLQIDNERKNGELKNEELRRQSIILRDQLTKLQGTLRKGQIDYKTRAGIIAQAQRQAKVRYETAIQQKVVQIQRLKLQVKQLQQQVKKEQTFKRQLELSQNKLRLKQKQELQHAQRSRYLQKMIQTFESQIRSYKNSKEQLLGQLKLLQRQVLGKKQLEDKVISFENDLLIERSKYDRLVQQKNKDQAVIRELKQKYEDSQIIRERINSNSNAKQKQLQFQMRQIEQNLDQKVFQVQQLYSQCQKYKNQVKNYEEKERFLKRQLEQIKYRSNAAEEELKARRNILEEKHYDNQAIIQEQKRAIQILTLNQKQKHHQIQVLLQKISYLEGEMTVKTARQTHQQDTKKNQRKNQLQKAARLCGLTYIDDETTLGAISDCVSSCNSKISVLQSELSEYRKMISQLKEDKENLSQKYQKYKSVAMQYKDRKQMQRLMLRNTYRFNDQILTHCQNIIKGVDK